MPGKRARISRKSVAALERGNWISDDTLPGFKVRRPNKLALYGLNIRLNGRMRWISLGTEAELTPDQARAEAERIRGLKRQGQDPATERERRKHGATVKTIAERFMASHVRKKLRPSTQRFYEDHLYRLVLPMFGTWRLDSITATDIAEWHSSKHATPTQANRALAVMSSLFGWAADHGLHAGENPCHRVKRYRETLVNQYLTTAQISAILGAADDLAAEGRISIFMAAGLRTLALTGARRSEIFGARWTWLDPERGDLVLPDSKTGAKRIALPTAAIETIESLPRIAGCPFIFPSFSRRYGRWSAYVQFGTAWSRVLERANVGHWRIHDLRHGFASAAVEGGVPLFTLGKVLGQAQPTTTQRYAHLADDPKRAVVDAVAAAIGGKKP